MKCVYNCCIQSCVFFKRQLFRFHQSTTNWYRSIPIYISIGIDNRYQIIDNHTNLRHRLVIDYQYQSINWYRLILIIIDYRFHRLDISGPMACNVSVLSLKGRTGRARGAGWRFWHFLKWNVKFPTHPEDNMIKDPQAGAKKPHEYVNMQRIYKNYWPNKIWSKSSFPSVYISIDWKYEWPV